MGNNNKNINVIKVVELNKNVEPNKNVGVIYASPLLRDTFIIYLISFIIILAITIAFSYMYGEVIIDNFMLNFRSYLLGSIYTGDDILSARFESIGIFAVHFTLFFAYFFLYLFYNSSGEQKNNDKYLLIMYFIVGLTITIFMHKMFLFCLPEALTLASFITLCNKTIFKNITIEYRYIILLNRILLTLTSIYGIVSLIIHYI